MFFGSGFPGGMPGFGGMPGGMPGGPGGGKPVDNERYYKVLGVNRNASDSEIKKAHRKLALQYHPDKGERARPAIRGVEHSFNQPWRQQFDSGTAKTPSQPTFIPQKFPGGDEEKFKEINEAFDVLRDPEKRKIYDQVRRHCLLLVLCRSTCLCKPDTCASSPTRPVLRSHLPLALLCPFSGRQYGEEAVKEGMGGGGGGAADIFDLFGMGGMGRRGAPRERRSEDVVHKMKVGSGLRVCVLALEGGARRRS